VREGTGTTGAGTGVSERSLLTGMADVSVIAPPPAADRSLPIEASSSPAPAWHGLFHPVRPDIPVRALCDALSLEWERGTAFLFVPVLLAMGALTYFALRVEPGFPALILGAVLVAAAAYLARFRLVPHLAVMAVLIVVLGIVLGKVETWRTGTMMLGSEISTVLTGRVVTIEQQASGRVRLTIDVIRTERPALRYAPERIRASARSVPENLRAGDAISGIVRLFPPSGPLRPGSYDFSFQSYFKGIGANGFFLRDPVRADAEAASLFQRIDAWIENARLVLATRIRGRIGGPEGEVAAALVAGVEAGIPEDVNEVLRRTGLAHVLSISGLHMALVAATIMGVLRGLFALFSDFASRRPVKKYAAGVALCAIAIYLLISGSAVAAERSFLMLAVMLVALLFDRAALTMRNLAISAIVIVVLSPHEVAGPSFQMSFAATAALIGIYAWWSQRRRDRSFVDGHDRPLVFRVLRAIGFYVLALATTSLIAGGATTIYAVWHFQRVAPLSLFANLCAMPVVSLAVMPFAVLGMAAMPFGLDGPFFDVMGRGLAAMIAIARWFSDRSPIDAVGAIPLSAVVFLTAALILATLATTRLRMASLPFIVLGFTVLMLRTMPDALISEDARLVAVPQGDGTLAVNRARPNGFTVEDWMRATGMQRIAKPKDAGSLSDLFGATPFDATMADRGFACADGLCAATTRSGMVVATAKTPTAAKGACGHAALVVVDDATATDMCPNGATTVLTKRDLARRGSATVAPGDAGPVVTFSIDEPFRPWHEARRYSRAARGMPEYRRNKPDSDAE
jgi:competence protein ComEC